MRAARLPLLVASLFLITAEAALAQTPGPPRALTAAQSEDRSVILSWTAPTTGGSPTGYIVLGGTSSGATNTVNQQIGNTTTYTTGPLVAGTTYYFRVRALNGFGVSDASAEVAITINCPPLPPPDVLVWRRLSATTARIIWNHPNPFSGTVDYMFRVEMGSAPGLSDLASMTVDGNRSYTDVTHTAGSGTVYARVRRTRLCGNDGPASEEIAVPARVTPPSTAILVNELHRNFLELKNALSTSVNVGGWRVFTSGEVGGVDLTAVFPSGTVIAPGCTYLLSYIPVVDRDLALTRSAVHGAGIVLPTGEIVDSVGRWFGNAATSISAFAEGMPLPQWHEGSPTSNHSFARVADRDTDDNSADFIRLPTPTPLGSAACNGIPPGPPGSFAVAVNGPTVTLSWRPPTSGQSLTHYVLQIGLSSGGNEFDPFILAPSLTSVTFANAPNGTFYARLRAVNTHGVSPPSNEVVILVCHGPACVVVPGPVTQLTQQVSGRNVLLSWRRPTTGGTPTGYVIEAGTAPGLANLGQFPTGSTSEFVIIAGVPPGTYYVRMRAVNGGGAGAASNDVTIVVQ